jgi:hypothetical protein
MSGKKFLVTSPPPPPPARQQLWEKILMLSLPVRANYTVPPKQDDAHTPMVLR